VARSRSRSQIRRSVSRWDFEAPNDADHSGNVWGKKCERYTPQKKTPPIKTLSSYVDVVVVSLLVSGNVPKAIYDNPHERFSVQYLN